MENITTLKQLKDTIEYLELQQTCDEKILKEQFSICYDNFKLVNTLKNIFKDFVETTISENKLVSLGATVLSGYVSKKLVVGKSNNLFRDMLGSVTSSFVSKFVANNADSVELVGNKMIGKLFKKEKE